MISSFKLLNTATRESVLFGQEPTSQYIYEDGDIDWGVANANHNTYNYPGQIGYTIASTSVMPRDISIQGYCYYIPTESELATLSRNEIDEVVYARIKSKKDKLNKIVNPLDRVRIIIGKYYIEGKPSTSVRYGNTMQENNEYFCKFLIPIYCSNPMFIQDASIIGSLRSSEPKFHFPWVLPKNKGYVISVIRSYRIIVIENTGSIATGCIITLEARGIATNPTINNIITGESIKIHKAMEVGEKIIINTMQGDERGIVGIINGKEENYFGYWDFNNDWMQLPIGISTIGYTIDEEAKTNLDITIAFKPMEYGLEEM